MCFHIILIGTFSANVSKEEDNSAGSTDFIESVDADLFQPKNLSTKIPKRPRVEKGKSKLRDSSLLEDFKDVSQRDDDISTLCQ